MMREREREYNSIINGIDTINIDPGEYVPQDEIRVKAELSKQVPRTVTKQVPRTVTKQVPRTVTKQVPRTVTKQVPREVRTPYTVLVPDYMNESGWEYVQGAGYHTYQKNYNNDNSTPNNNYDVWVARRDGNLVTGVQPIRTHDVFDGYDEYDNEIYITIIDTFRVFIKASSVTTETRYNTTIVYDTVQETVYDTVQETVYDTVQETVYDTVQETVYDTVSDVRLLKYIDLESVMASEGWTSVQILNNYLTYQDLNEIGIYI